ncbi:hypothetical protein [Hymenobacter cheonanensis]|uniref:hypothetical protein n=1 Tax=Hymenobacter sp. CA2-7 TaxID=3063993 RepID=UPI002713B421|nr:hypothetical protein [Hymenobacter sp. CA2-7]MDO7887062.1 hypothetical protein [Hymenobacter sp. CA2-7]
MAKLFERGCGRWLRLGLVIAGWLLASPALAQRYHYTEPDEFSGKVLPTATGSILIFNNFQQSGLNFSVRFDKERVEPIYDNMVYTINGTGVEFLPPETDSAPTDSPAVILARVVNSNVSGEDHFGPAPLWHVESVVLPGIYPAATLCYQLKGEGPAGRELRFMALYFMHGTNVLVLGSHMLPAESTAEVKARLLRTATSITFSPTPINPPASYHPAE